jgi:ferredoxin-NADP reductase/ferredoxin
VLESAHGQPLLAALPGQYVVVRVPEIGGRSPLFRSYSLSGAASTERYRISVKLEPNGVAGKYLCEHVRPGTTLDVSAPRGSFVLEPDARPVVLLSAGIGVTPVLAMLHALAAGRSTRQVWWCHGARDGRHHPFAEEVRALVAALPSGRAHVRYSAPRPGDELGRDFDAAGHLSLAALQEIGVPSDSDVYLCGPARFMAEMKEALASLHVAPAKIHGEIFSGGESLTPGVVGAAKRAPHVPQDDAASGPLVSFARSGIIAHWKQSAHRSILELAEACDVPVRWSCRSGVCHSCESGLVSGAVSYCPAPLDAAAAGNVLLCCSQPAGDIVLDL